MLVGYMRVSMSDERQSVDLHRDALLGAGVDERHLHQDRASGARDNRPGLNACIEDLRPGDVLVVWKIDRLGRSLSHLIRIVEQPPICCSGMAKRQSRQRKVPASRSWPPRVNTASFSLASVFRTNFCVSHRSR